MLLFRGISPYRPLESFEEEDGYISSLHSLNEQLSFVLRLRKTILLEHVEDKQVQASLVLLAISLLYYLGQQDSRKNTKEEWKREYLDILEGELIIRAIKLAELLLNTCPAPLLRTLGLSHWTEIASKFYILYADLVYALLTTLFRVGLLIRKELVAFIRAVKFKEIEGDDIAVLCLLLAAAQITAKEMGTSTRLTEIILMVGRANDVTVASQGFQYLGRLSIWDDELGVNQIVNDDGLLESLYETDELIPDLIISSGVARIRPLAQALQEAIVTRKKLNIIIEALPKLTLTEAKLALTRHDGDTTRAIACTKMKRTVPNETALLLDDKSSYTKASIERILSTTAIDDDEEKLYEDEYVDTFDDDNVPPNPVKKQDLDISRRKVRFLIKRKRS